MKRTEPSDSWTMGVAPISGAPLIWSTTVEEIASGAFVGTTTRTPSDVTLVFNFLPVARSFADVILFFSPGTGSLPSAGQLKT